jgi:RNA polymerase sigma factor (sigma-70 family)
VRRVTVNLAIDARRRRTREIREAQRNPPIDVASAVDVGAEQSEVWQAVRALPDRQRAAVVLRYVDDMTVADIAAVLDVTEGTIKASLSQARASLARALDAIEEVEADG